MTTSTGAVNNILFLLVNFYNETEVADFVIKELSPYAGQSFEVIIIDNGSHNKELISKLPNSYSWVTYLDAKENKGYFGAASKGLNHYLEKNGAFPAKTIICNTDISFKSKNFITELQKNLDADVTGPDIYSTLMRSHQNPYILKRISPGKVNSLRMLTSGIFAYYLLTLLHLAKTKILRSGSVQKQYDTPLETYAVHGSFIIFNRSFFEKGGTINYPSVLFGEELFVAEQCFKLGLKTVYQPALKIDHNEHATTGIFKSRKAIHFMHQSYQYLYDQYFSK